MQPTSSFKSDYIIYLRVPCEFSLHSTVYRNRFVTNRTQTVPMTMFYYSNVLKIIQINLRNKQSKHRPVFPLPLLNIETNVKVSLQGTPTQD